MANKTVPGTLDVEDYIASIESIQRREDCQWLLHMMTALSGETPKIWGGQVKSAIVGFGDYHYKYDSGREGEFLRTGFANRAKAISLYIMPGYQDFGEMLSRLGKHRMGKACLYIKRLSDVDTDVLKEIVQAGLDVMDEKYPRR